MKKIFLLNGPASSGKDTAAEFIERDYISTSFHYKMAKPLKEWCHNILGLKGTLKELEHLKEFPICYKKADGSDMTLREFYITMSENYFKPTFGKDFFGRAAAKYISENAGQARVIPISDSGFAYEARPVIEKFGAENVCLVRIFRPGKTFGSDSRSYISLPVETYDIFNNTSLDDLFYKTNSIVEAFSLGKRATYNQNSELLEQIKSQFEFKAD